MTAPLELAPEYCRLRQQRVRALLERRSLDRAVIISPENIQYLTGFRPHRLVRAAVCLEVSGRCTLAAPNEVPENAAADDIVTFEAQWLATLRQEQEELALAALADQVGWNSKTRTGAEFSACGAHVRHLAGGNGDGLVDLDAELWSLRRRKDPDELALIRRAVDCTEAMYRRAREIIEPGISELDVFNQLHAAAVLVAGEPLTALGNDYQCNSLGGPPRDRPAGRGELFILDLGPAYRGYYADNCRTMSVGGPPTDQQLQAWDAIAAVLATVEREVRPGISCRAVYQEAREMLAEAPAGTFPHHLGHGFGLFPHEAPHLNPNWDDCFEEGDCFTAEPGLYAPHLKTGIRLEQNYRVTATGVERLTSYPLDL
jgi:Xaa-Pro dipeptidase